MLRSNQVLNERLLAAIEAGNLKEVSECISNLEGALELELELDLDIDLARIIKKGDLAGASVAWVFAHLHYYDLLSTLIDLQQTNNISLNAAPITSKYKSGTLIAQIMTYCSYIGDNSLLEKILKQSPNEPLRPNTDCYGEAVGMAYAVEKWDMLEMIYDRSDKTAPLDLLHFPRYGIMPIAWKLALHKKIHLLKKILADCAPEASQPVEIRCHEEDEPSLAWLLAAQEEWSLLEKIKFSYPQKDNFHKIFTLEGWPCSGKSLIQILREHGKEDLLKKLQPSATMPKMNELLTLLKYGELKQVQDCYTSPRDVYAPLLVLNQTGNLVVDYPLDYAAKEGRFDIVKFLYGLLIKDKTLTQFPSKDENPLIWLLLAHEEWDLVKSMVKDFSSLAINYDKPFSCKGNPYSGKSIAQILRHAEQTELLSLLNISTFNSNNKDTSFSSESFADKIKNKYSSIFKVDVTPNQSTITLSFTGNPDDIKQLYEIIKPYYKKETVKVRQDDLPGKQKQRKLTLEAEANKLERLFFNNNKIITESNNLISKAKPKLKTPTPVEILDSTFPSEMEKLSDEQQRQWLTELKRVFCYAEEIEIEHRFINQDKVSCFYVKLPSTSLTIRKQGESHQQLERYHPQNNHSIYEVLKNRFDITTIATIEWDADNNQFKIFPLRKIFPSANAASLHNAVYKYIENNYRLEIINKDINNNQIKNDKKQAKGKKNENKSTNPIIVEKTPNITAADIQKLFKDIAKNEHVEKFFSELTADSKKQKIIFTFNLSKSIAGLGYGQVPSDYLFTAMQDTLNAVVPGLVTLYTHAEEKRLVIVVQTNDFNPKLFYDQLTSLQGAFQCKLDEKIAENAKLLQSSELTPLPKEMPEKSEPVAKEKKYAIGSFLYTSFKDDKQRANLQFHIQSLLEISSYDSNDETMDAQANYFAYMLYAFSAMRILADKIATPFLNKIIYDERNLLRHAYKDFSFERLKELFLPLFQAIARLNNMEKKQTLFFSPGLQNLEKEINDCLHTLKAAAEPYQEQLNHRTLGKTTCSDENSHHIERCKQFLIQMSQQPEYTFTMKVAILQVCSLLVEMKYLEGKEYKELYRKLGHDKQQFHAALIEEEFNTLLPRIKIDFPVNTTQQGFCLK